MRSIPVTLSGDRSYQIEVGLPLEQVGEAVKRFGLGPSALVASVPPVARRYARRLVGGLKKAGFRVSLATMRDGEAAKNLDAVRKLYREMVKAKLDRRSVLIALGGGVVGDTAGFAAATYMRGIPFVQCPTTLLAMVDSAIGGKVAVDLPEGKNLVGAFWQPRLVAVDLSTLSTLPTREWRTGMAEVIKYGLIADARLIEEFETKDFDTLQKDPALQEHWIGRSAAIKADVVSRDERETLGLREILNLGHTFGHGLEAVTGYKAYTHGEAIAIGMCAAGRLAHQRGLVGGDYVPRVEALFTRWGLPVRARRKPSRAALLAAMARDKKNVGGAFRFVLPLGWGKVQVVKDVPPATVNDILTEVGL